ncbi:MAG: GTPase Era [Patescibacteria group bacterium]|nr:GTPase Era [Patescibacteria group bacterium]
MSTSESPLLKSGMATLIGRSNTGKSTLLNALVGTKLAIVTHRPQTTRNVIHGVLNSPAGQAVFLDTPGVFKESRNPLSGKLTERVKESLKEIDLIVYVVDPTKGIGAEERYILSMVRHADIPKIMVINKSDLPKAEKEFLDDYRALAEDFSAVFELSALHNRHVQPLRDKVFELLPAGEPLYPPDQLTNSDPKFWVAEIIREKIFLALRKEVPYSTHVEVVNIEEKPDVFSIQANIYTFDSRYKRMIIGAKGRALKEIGIAARKELEVALGKKVYLALEVETDKRWEERA